MESPYVEFSLKSGEGSTITHIVASRASGSVAAEPLDAGKYSYLWTGHTDSGDLPSVAETGHYALALSSLTEVKARAELEFQRLLGYFTESPNVFPNVEHFPRIKCKCSSCFRWSGIMVGSTWSSQWS